MNQQDWANAFNSGQQGNWAQRQMLGMQNALAPQTNEERIEYNLREISAELNEIKRELRLNKKQRRFEFTLVIIFSVLSPFVLWLLLRHI